MVEREDGGVGTGRLLGKRFAECNSSAERRALVGGGRGSFIFQSQGILRGKAVRRIKEKAARGPSGS